MLCSISGAVRAHVLDRVAVRHAFRAVHAVLHDGLGSRWCRSACGRRGGTARASRPRPSRGSCSSRACCGCRRSRSAWQGSGSRTSEAPSAPCCRRRRYPQTPGTGPNPSSMSQLKLHVRELHQHSPRRWRRCQLLQRASEALATRCSSSSQVGLSVIDLLPSTVYFLPSSAGHR